MDQATVPDTLRPFGDAADLNLDFGQESRPELVTSLLAQCDSSHDAAFWWSQTVGSRTAALLRLVAGSEQRQVLTLNHRCRSAGCGVAFEFELPLLSLADLGVADSGAEQVRLGDERAVAVRRATGEDLRRWRAERPASTEEALRLMFDALVLEGDVVSADEPLLSAAIADADPLVDFSVACSCPACGVHETVEVDLESLALSRLMKRQSLLLREVHQFASRYGWTESQVLAVPPARRAQYLSLMEYAP